MPRKKPTIQSVLDKDYFSKEEIRKFIPGTDFHSRKERSNLYKIYDCRLCNKVDLSRWIDIFETKKENRLLGVNCLKNITNNNVILMEHNKARFIIYEKCGRWFIKSPIKGLADEPDEVKGFTFAMNLCLSKMI